MPSRCSVSRVEDRSRWDAFFSQVARPDMMQSWTYGEARLIAGAHSKARDRVIDTGGWHPRRLIIERSGVPVALCQRLDKTVAGLPVVSRLHRGPLFLGDEFDPAVVRDVYAMLRRQWHLRGRMLVLAPALPASHDNYGLLKGLGFRDRGLPGFSSSRVDLLQDEDRLLMNLRPTWRNRLRSSLRSGLELEVSQKGEVVEWMIGRHEENMAAKGFVGPSRTLLRALHQVAPDDLVVYRALLDGRPVGGMLVFGYGTAAMYYVGWMGHAGRAVNVGNFLYWRIVLDLKSRGYRWFDLGGERVNATAQFKRGMRGETYEYLNEWLSF
jgi:hypothetical protein